MLDLSAPHSSAFIIVGMRPFAYFVSFATVLASTNFLLSASFASSRFVYVLALDGLLFSCFAKVNTRTKTPLEATLSLGVAVFFLALLFDIATLLELAIIDSLIFAVLIAAAVLIVRYCPAEQCPFPLVALLDTTLPPSSEPTDLENEKAKLIIAEKTRDTENIGKLKPIFKNNAFLQTCVCMSFPFTLPNTCIVVFCILLFVVNILLNISIFYQFSVDWIFLIIISILLFVALLPILILTTFEDNKNLGHIQVINDHPLHHVCKIYLRYYVKFISCTITYHASTLKFSHI